LITEKGFFQRNCQQRKVQEGEAREASTSERRSRFGSSSELRHSQSPTNSLYSFFSCLFLVYRPKSICPAFQNTVPPHPSVPCLCCRLLLTLLLSDFGLCYCIVAGLTVSNFKMAPSLKSPVFSILPCLISPRPSPTLVCVYFCSAFDFGSRISLTSWHHRAKIRFLAKRGEARRLHRLHSRRRTTSHFGNCFLSMRPPFLLFLILCVL
jgi:hypothetical protein